MPFYRIEGQKDPLLEIKHQDISNVSKFQLDAPLVLQERDLLELKDGQWNLWRDGETHQIEGKWDRIKE